MTLDDICQNQKVLLISRKLYWSQPANVYISRTSNRVPQLTLVKILQGIWRVSRLPTKSFLTCATSMLISASLGLWPKLLRTSRSSERLILPEPSRSNILKKLCSNYSCLHILILLETHKQQKETSEIARTTVNTWTHTKTLATHRTTPAIIWQSYR